ncbi:MAG: helix-turn-helix domain-containing protein [Alphaproteobacteria bacterium]|nr:helix-turn-helix domain-containing protein [Alphaproteobacteria bacterium]
MNTLAQKHLSVRPQLDVSRQLGVSQAYLSQLLSGQRRPSLELAVRIEQMTGGTVPASSWVDDPAIGEAHQ